MNKKHIIAAFFLCVAVFFQIAVAPHIGILSGGWSEWINFCTLSVAVISLFERRRGKLGWFASVFTGLFLDLYSRYFFGFWIIVLIVLTSIIKFVIKKYVRAPSFW